MIKNDNIFISLFLLRYVAVRTLSGGSLEITLTVPLSGGNRMRK